MNSVARPCRGSGLTAYSDAVAGLTFNGIACEPCSSVASASASGAARPSRSLRPIGVREQQLARGRCDRCPAPRYSGEIDAVPAYGLDGERELVGGETFASAREVTERVEHETTDGVVGGGFRVELDPVIP